MIVSIHQPQYFPWLPYFLKLGKSDVFILLDSVDFQKNGLQNRNQIKTAQGAQWLTVPVCQNLGQKILEVKIDNKVDWKKKHWLTIQQSYRKAKAFNCYAQGIEDVFSQDWTWLNDLNIHLFKLMKGWLGIDCQIKRSSEMRSRGKGSELILNLCLETGATQYASGTGGQNYLEEDSFLEAGVEIIYYEPELPTSYPQLHPQAGFLNSLSVLDMILNCGQDWRSYLNKD
jgi:hypothetical protein